MFQSVTVVNHVGDSLELPLRWPNDAGLLLYKIEGITPGDVVINSQDYAVIDGGVYNSSRMETRDIDLYFYYGFTPQIESARHRAYRYFPVKEKVRLYFLTDERSLYIEGYVRENDTQIFSEQEEGKVSITCVDPYFYEVSDTFYQLGQAKKEFEFPFSNESLTEPSICFSDWGTRYTYEIGYQGDMNVGAIIRIYFIKKPSDLDWTIRVHDVSHSKNIIFNLQEIKDKAGLEIQQYSSLVVSSVRGQKDVYYEYFATRHSILGLFDVVNFPWMYLTPGNNYFSITMEEQYYDDVRITIEHSGAYGGV